MPLSKSATTLVLLLAAAACSSDQPTQSSAADAANAANISARQPEARHAGVRFVATASNDVAQNEILFFARNSNGTLGTPTRFATGGKGSGGGLGNQSGLVIDDDAKHLYVVNAGSNSITMFAVRPYGLEHRQTISSGGVQPISLALGEDVLYVLNDGGTANITGFHVGYDGTLAPISNSTRALSADVPDAAQVGFNRSERRLIVTEKATNKIVTFRLDRFSRPGAPIINTSNGATPFGFYVDERRGEVIVSEAFGGAPDGSAVSSYRLRAGRLQTISGSVPTMETAACWIALSGDGKFAYTSNTGSNSITGYAISRRGELTALNASGIDAVTGAGPIDLATRDGLDLLYSLNRAGGSLSIFRIKGDGTLESIGTVADIPTSANGLVTF